MISLATLHNLRVFDLQKALREIERVGKHSYIMVESYRNEQELFNLQCWALTAEAFFDTDGMDVALPALRLHTATTSSSIFE